MFYKEGSILKLTKYQEYEFVGMNCYLFAPWILVTDIFTTSTDALESTNSEKKA